MSEGPTEYEIRLLRELVTGEPQGLTWGAAMSVAVEYLSEAGYLTRGPKYEATQKARDFIAQQDAARALE